MSLLDRYFDTRKRAKQLEREMRRELRLATVRAIREVQDYYTGLGMQRRKELKSIET